MIYASQNIVYLLHIIVTNDSTYFNKIKPQNKIGDSVEFLFFLFFLRILANDNNC